MLYDVRPDGSFIEDLEEAEVQNNVKTKISLEDDGDEYGRISFDFETTPDKILKAVQDKAKLLERNTRDSTSESIDKIGENSKNDETLSRKISRSSSFILHADDISKSDLQVYQACSALLRHIREVC